MEELKMRKAYSKRIRFDRIAICGALATFALVGSFKIMGKSNDLKAETTASAEDNVITKDKIDSVEIGNSIGTESCTYYDGDVYAAKMLSSYKTPQSALYDTKNSTLIKCMGYTGTGTTYTGVATYEGCVAGKEEWIGKTCRLYAVDDAGNFADFIGEYKFDDTGYGVNGNIQNGNAISIWHSNEESYNEWKEKYGDYVYMCIVDE
jgi:hypothetical protein